MISIFSAMDAKCLKNPHTEELVFKDYLKQWLTKETKVNLSFIWFWFFFKMLNVTLFCMFDVTLVAYENSLIEPTKDVCMLSLNATSCVQHYYNVWNIYFSLTSAYISMGLLLFLNVAIEICDIITAYNLCTKFKHLTKESDNRETLTHSLFYLAFQLVADASLILNITLRFLRHVYGVKTRFYIDNITLYCIHLGFFWSVLYLVQLVPYVGYVASVMKLMMKDTFIFLILIFFVCIPCHQLFPRIINHKTALHECDPDWKNMGADKVLIRK